MGDDEEEKVAPPQVEGAPEGAGDEGRAGEHQVAGEHVDPAVDNRGSYVSPHIPPSGHHFRLEKAPPEDLLTGTGDEEEENEDEKATRPGAEAVDPAYLSGRPAQNVRGKLVPEKKKKVEGRGGKDPEEEGAEAEQNCRPLKDQGIGRHQEDGEAYLDPEVARVEAEGKTPAYEGEEHPSQDQRGITWP